MNNNINESLTFGEIIEKLVHTKQSIDGFGEFLYEHSVSVQQAVAIRAFIVVHGVHYSVTRSVDAEECFWSIRNIHNNKVIEHNSAHSPS